jgi:hypothetical protein
VALWAGALGLIILLGGGYRRSHVRPQAGAINFQNFLVAIYIHSVHLCSHHELFKFSQGSVRGKKNAGVNMLYTSRFNSKL